MPPPPLTPRPPSKYDPARDLPSQQGTIGNHIVKPGSDVVIKKPSWEGKETVFRMFPAPNHEAPMERFDPYRLDPSGKALISFLRRYDVAWGVGNPSTTFLLKNPEEQDPTYDRYQTPLGVLFRAISKVCSGNQGHGDWYPLVKGASGKGQALTGPKDAYFIQGSMVKHADRPTARDGKAPLGWPPNPPLVIMLSGGAGRKLLELLDQENDGVDLAPPAGPTEYDAYFKARYKYGDPVGINAGKYVHVFEKGHDPRDRYRANPTTRTGASPFAAPGQVTSSGHQQQDEEFKGYDMFLSDDAGMGYPVTLNQPFQLEAIRKQWRWWEDFLYFPTYAEQAHLLFRIFPPSACYYAFEGLDSTWIPEWAHAALVNAVSAAVPGRVPGGPVPGAVTSPFGHLPAPQPSPYPPQPAPVSPFAAPVITSAALPANPGTSSPFSGPPPAARPAPVTPAPAPAPAPAQPPAAVTPFAMPGPAMDAVVPTADIPSSPAPYAPEGNLPHKTAEAVAALAAARALNRQGPPVDPGQPASL